MDVRDIGRKAAGAAWDKVSQTGRDALGKAADRDWAKTALDSVDRPAAPADRLWELSIAALVGRHPRVPGVAVKLLGLLDGFGAVAVGPGKVGFDGDEPSWDKVLEVRTHSMAGILPDSAVEKEIDRIRAKLPPVPGRKWVVTKATEGLLTLVMAATDIARHTEDRQIACEIVYSGLLGRPKQVPAGLVACAILTAIPEASDSIVATAQARGIPVRPVVSGGIVPRTERAERLQQATSRLAARLRELREDARDEYQARYGDSDGVG